ncbi:MAG: AbrB/MazE/SpoVT family DNA-binding domain-containing protein [Syntrophomonadaceae bacterium]|jgi:antitoxin MazE
MQTKVTKWGNSLGVRIPQWIAEQTEINDGVVVDIDLEDDLIIIRKRRHSLEELLEGITQDNLHQEIDNGLPMGREIW